MSMVSALHTLESKLAGCVLVGDAAAPYAKDDSPTEPVTPMAVVHANSDNDVKQALTWALEYRVPVTPRGAGSGRVGGAVPSVGGIVLSTSGMDAIEDIDEKNLSAVVGPGVVLEQLQTACEARGLFYPPDPNSRSLCMIGGNIATNAAGPRAFRYGPTRNYVSGLELCLMGGTEMRVGSRTRKGVTGYDVTGLMVGSEGTLAVVTRAYLKLLPAPIWRGTLCVYAHSNAAALQVAALAARAPEQPECVEFVDEQSLHCMRGAGVKVPTGALAMVLLDVVGRSAYDDLGSRLAEVAGVHSLVGGISHAEREQIWAARSDLSYATRRLAAGKYSEDVVVPVARLSELLDGVAALADRHRVQHLTYGHAGDGNMHVNLLWQDEAQRMRCHEAIGDLMRLTLSLEGTLSGEHGIGITKSPYLGLEQSAELIALQRQLKCVFDPHGLMNPGKVFGNPTHSAC